MRFPVKDKVAIVTGASQGIGAHLVESLRRRGARVVLCARDEARLAALAGPEDLVVAGDLTAESTREEIVARAAARYGRIDALINNAGRGSYYRPSESPLDDARGMFELNFFAPMHLTQLALPWLRRTGGMVVNVSSIAGQISLPWLPVYSASKFALGSMTACFGMELRPAGVHAMTVYPGYVDTDFQAHAAGSPPPAAVVKGKRFAVTAERCAEDIVRGMERKKRAVVTPAIGLPLVWFNRIFPRLVESRMELH